MIDAPTYGGFSVCSITPVPPYLGYVEFVVNGGGSPPALNFLLQEDGFFLLQEDGSKLIVT